VRRPGYFALSLTWTDKEPNTTEHDVDFNRKLGWVPRRTVFIHAFLRLRFKGSGSERERG